MPGRDLLARARHRHGRGRSRDPGRVAEVGRARPAAHRARGPRRRASFARAGSSPSSAATCSSARSSSRSMREGRIEQTVVPRNALDVLAQQIVAIAADERERVGRRARRARHPHPLLQRALARAARERARHARRPLPLERVRRAAAANHLGSHRGHDPRAQGRAEARGRQRRHDPRPRPLPR